MTILRRLLPALAVFAAACSDQPVTQDRPDPVTSLTIDNLSLALGDRSPITARVVVDGASRVVTAAEFTVASSDPTVIEVTPDRVLIAHREGTATVTVTLTANPTVTFARTMQVAPPSFVALHMVAPGALIPGDSGGVTFAGYTHGGATIANPPALTLTSRRSVLQVVNNTLVIATDTGSTWLVGRTPDGATDSALVTITLGAPVDLTIAPHAATVDIGDTVRIVTQLFDRRMNDVTVPVQFRSLNAGIATVSTAGVVVARAGGTTRIIASYSNLADTLVTAVNSPPPPPPGDPAPPDPVEPPPPPPPPPGSPPVTVTPPGAYVQVRLSGSPSPAVITAFTNAAARINALLTRNAGAFDVDMFVPEGYCFTTQPELNEVVSGLLITASVGPIDGPSNILGFAGPCLIRVGALGLPALGIMAFDEADMQYMASTNILGGVVLHEMMHVLGIGTLWGPAWQGWVADPYGANPRFTGSTGRAQYTLLDLLDGPNGVPVENTGGSGTRGGHWRESVFNTELMTGWAGGAMAMSRVTIGALRDMGYDADLSRADSYPLGSIMLDGFGRGPEIVDRMLHPVGTIDRIGRIR